MKRQLMLLRINRNHNRFWVFLDGKLFLRTALTAFVPRHLSAELRPNQMVLVYRSVTSLFGKSQPEVGLTIPHHGLLGNTIAALAPRVAFAVRHGFDHVYALRESVLSTTEIFSAAGTHHVPGLPGLTIGNIPKGALQEVGTIVHLRGVPAPTGPLAMSHADDAWKLLSSALLSHTRVKCHPPETLVIHLRGGDVYAGRRHLPNHGQPPLAYYRFVMSRQKWKRVLIVHQGPIPILPGLAELCDELSIPLQTQSLSLREDVASLLGATSLVVGRGSFAPAVVGLSRCVREVYMFESGFGLSNPKSTVLIHRVVDKKGDYRRAVLAQNWTRAQEQIDLMNSYPVTNLSLGAEEQ